VLLLELRRAEQNNGNSYPKAGQTGRLEWANLCAQAAPKLESLCTFSPANTRFYSLLLLFPFPFLLQFHSISPPNSKLRSNFAPHLFARRAGGLSSADYCPCFGSASMCAPLAEFTTLLGRARASCVRILISHQANHLVCFLSLFAAVPPSLAPVALRPSAFDCARALFGQKCGSQRDWTQIGQF